MFGLRICTAKNSRKCRLCTAFYAIMSGKRASAVTAISSFIGRIAGGVALTDLC